MSDTNTVYALLDDQGQISAISKKQIHNNWLPVLSSDEKIKAFVNSSTTEFEKRDLTFIRVLEDLIDILIDKGTINFTDLPPASQNKLMERKQYRVQALHENNNGLINNDDQLY